MNDIVRTAHVLDVFYPAGLARADYLDALTKAAELLRRLESAAPVQALVSIPVEAEPASAPEPEPVAVIAPPAPVPAPPVPPPPPAVPATVDVPVVAAAPPRRGKARTAQTATERAVSAFSHIPSRLIPASVIGEIVGVDSGTTCNAAKAAGWAPAVPRGSVRSMTPAGRWFQAVMLLGRPKLLEWFDTHHTGRVPHYRDEIIEVADQLRRDSAAKPTATKVELLAANTAREEAKRSKPQVRPVPPPRPFAVERDEAKEAERERIAKGLEEFKARGGQVKRVVLPGSPEIGREVAVSERGVA